MGQVKVCQRTHNHISAESQASNKLSQVHTVSIPLLCARHNEQKPNFPSWFNSYFCPGCDAGTWLILPILSGYCMLANSFSAVELLPRRNECKATLRECPGVTSGGSRSPATLVLQCVLSSQGPWFCRLKMPQKRAPRGDGDLPPAQEMGCLEGGVLVKHRSSEPKNRLTMCSGIPGCWLVFG